MLRADLSLSSVFLAGLTPDDHYQRGQHDGHANEDHDEVAESCSPFWDRRRRGQGRRGIGTCCLPKVVFAVQAVVQGLCVGLSTARTRGQRALNPSGGLNPYGLILRVPLAEPAVVRRTSPERARRPSEGGLHRVRGAVRGGAAQHLGTGFSVTSGCVLSSFNLARLELATKWVRIQATEMSLGADLGGDPGGRALVSEIFWPKLKRLWVAL